MNNYPVILADPPWPYTFSNTRAEQTPDDYPRMTTLDICALSVPAANNCALFLWANWPTLPDAFDVIRAWGFEYKTIAWVWAKLDRTGMGFFHGMGNYTRSNTEPCLLAVRSRMPVKVHDVQALIVSPVQAHSRKPDDQYRKIERLYDGPYLEMFARRTRAGWDVWGNEVESDIQIANTATTTTTTTVTEIDS